MTKQFFLFAFFLLPAEFMAQNTIVSGKTEDEDARPVPFANVWSGTEGAMSDESGFFRFVLSSCGDSIRLKASAIGHKSWERVFAPSQDSLRLVIVLKSQATDIEEVVVKGVMQRMKGNGAWNNLSPVALVTTGGAGGDLYRSLQILPGVQSQNESGKLVVRGGDSRETQTYIDDMHVLIPYTSTGEIMPVRGRYSPFMFEGINFSSGGYSQEYGDGLSAVLPLYTKDYSKLTKWGVNPSTVGLAGGGTRAFDRGSVSLNLEYRNMGPYFSAVPNRMNMTEPYRMSSAATQLRFTPDDRTVIKSYISYDNTRFAQGIMNLNEHNLYANTTFRHTSGNGYRLFAGTAFSGKTQLVRGARLTGDKFEDRAGELHLKAKISKRYTDFLLVSAGAESFIRRFGNEYADSAVRRTLSVKPDIFSAFAIATFYPLRNMTVEISGRMEGSALLPRLSANYSLSGVKLSATTGQYVQQADPKYLYENPGIEPERCRQYVAGAEYIRQGRAYRAEFYLKDYERLPLVSEGIITSGGYGYSKGFDLYFSDESLFENFDYQFSYTFNLAKRKSDGRRELTVPWYASRHNASAVLRYMSQPLRSIFGITYRFAGGRPYNGGLTKPYSSLDMSLTFLANPKLIVYGSATNLSGRKNQFCNAAGDLVNPAFDRFIYIGVFISFGKGSAYDTSNF
ncbi:MAG: TonB-dependent receptor [Tannerella sp.]|nr:TonB-dependent receptor [Tannerella sp.]